MVIYCTEIIAVYDEHSEQSLLNEMGMANWTLACTSMINNGVGAKYYFYKTIPDY